jgi:hypothetical protein
MRRFDLIRTGTLMGGAIGLIVLSATTSWAAPLGNYTFENSAGAFITNSETTVTGINLSAFSNSDGVTLSSNAGSGNPGLAYQSNGWTRKNSTADTDFLSFTVSPMANMKFTISKLLFDSKRGAGSGNSGAANSGPTLWALRSSIDQFAGTLDTGSLGNTNSWRSITVDVTAISDRIQPVVFRLYGYDSNAVNLANNFWSVDNVSIDGTVSPAASAVPTPAAIPAIVAFGVSLWRKRRGVTANQ